MELRDGMIVLDAALPAHRLCVDVWLDDAWQPCALAAAGEAFAGEIHDTRITLQLHADGDADAWRYVLSLQSQRPTRARLALLLPGAREPFHLIPGVIFGDNNLGGAEPGHFPNLTHEHAGNVSCSPSWEMRADRASHPLSAMHVGRAEGGEAGGAVAGVSIEPYSDARPSNARADETFTRNGLFAELAGAAGASVGGGGRGDGGASGASGVARVADGCGVTLGYRNAPRTFLNKDQWVDATQHLLTAGSARGRIFLRRAASRRDLHALVRRVYADHRETPVSPITQREAVAGLVDAFLRVNWHDQSGRNAVGTSGGKAEGFAGGGAFLENFTNMRCIDPQKKTLTAWRTLAEIGWTGGGVIGYPLLVAGLTLGDAVAVQRGRYMLDQVSRAFNPDSGLLWDVCGKHEGTRLNWWWSGYIVKDCHCAYTNGTACYYLLKAYLLAQVQTGGEEHAAWLDTARRALDTIVKLQKPDGNFGFTYRADRAEMLDDRGFAGAWFVPALAMLHTITGEPRYLEAARRGMDFYYRFVRELSCWGAPMDTWKAVDQEGNLAFIRGARLMHEVTGEKRYLDMLGDAAEYEYLWRYGFRARPEYPPLKDSIFNSCGGSITSVSNPHIHPMGVYVARDLAYLAEQGGDDYHRARCADGINWGVNIVSLYPEVSGYGIRGTITERYCPSDGLTIETFPDGSLSSLWFSYNGWAAAAVLEGLVEEEVTE